MKFFTEFFGKNKEFFKKNFNPLLHSVRRDHGKNFL